jgi:pyruvate,orthophosphate dikinase
MTKMEGKHVFKFGEGKADGNDTMRNLLGGKGASLAGATLLGLPVPPGFTISTEVCNIYLKTGGLSEEIKAEAKEALRFVEKALGKKFGDAKYAWNDGNCFECGSHNFHNSRINRNHK